MEQRYIYEIHFLFYFAVSSAFDFDADFESVKKYKKFTQNNL
jgi:hypothetical protein